MRIPYEWIKEFVDWPGSEAEMADALTMAGNEVDGIKDGVFDFKLTPNRGDCASVVGLAREAAALCGQPLKEPAIGAPESDEEASRVTRVEIRAPDLCPRYAARILRGVKVGPSPEWIQRRITAAGMRPVNNVVDVTNYVMLEMGQPLHAFDLSKLEEQRIVVRTAEPGEKITTLDGHERALDPSILVIADARVPIAIAGIMGGKDTEVTDDTQDILLESAHFNPQTIRVGARKLELPSAASYRFERGVDPELVVRAINRAAGLLAELAGARVARGVVDEYPKPPAPITVTLRPSRCNRMLGTQFTASEMVGALEALQLPVRALHRGTASEESIQVHVPTFRWDLRLEEDLIEEVGRILGYDRIPEALPNDDLEGSLAPLLQSQLLLRGALVSSGLVEANTHSMVSHAEATRLVEGEPLPPRNPVSEEYAVLRPSLLPGLLKAVAHNSRFGRRAAHFFEVGRVWTLKSANSAVQGPEGYTEHTTVAAVMMGHRMAGHWNLKPVPLETDFYAAKGVLEFLLEQARVSGAEYRPLPSQGLHPGRSAELWVGDRRLGRLGQIHPEVQEALDLPLPVYAFEVEVTALQELAQEPRYDPLSRFPAVTRDLAILLPAETPASRVAAIIHHAGQPFLEDEELFDLYTGERLGPDTKSLAFSLTLRSREGTLTDAQAESALAAIRQALTEQAGATFR